MGTAGLVGSGLREGALSVMYLLVGVCVGDLLVVDVFVAVMYTNEASAASKIATNTKTSDEPLFVFTILLYHGVMDELQDLAKQLVAPGKGILAADESLPTIEKRFKAIGIESTEETRRAYREMLFSTVGIEQYISGIIQFEETLKDGILKNPNIIPGIKVDQGTQDYKGNPNEKITKGIEGLAERLNEYKSLGARFAKWRAVFKITPETPSIQNLEENAILLAKYAKICQDTGFVPIVEPEVLMDGDHNIDRCGDVTRGVLKVVFLKLKEGGVGLRGMLLKPNMILPGEEYPMKATPVEVAAKTLEVLKEVVPQEVPGIVFLSGGQSEEEATENLREMNKLGGVQWQLSFSYGRALQNSALKTWAGKVENIVFAQQAFLSRAKMNSEARYGR